MSFLVGAIDISEEKGGGGKNPAIKFFPPPELSLAMPLDLPH